MNRGKRLKRRAELKRTGFRRKPKDAVKAKRSTPRARPGSMRSAVVQVLAGGVTIAEAAREHDVDPGRLWDRAWAEAKRVVMDRDHWTCGACGELAVDVHHRYRRGSGGTSDTSVSLSFSNLIGLCRADHDLAHAKDPGLRDRGFWLRADQKPSEVPVKVPGPFGSYQSLWLLPNGEYSLTSPSEVAA